MMIPDGSITLQFSFSQELDLVTWAQATSHAGPAELVAFCVSPTAALPLAGFCCFGHELTDPKYQQWMSTYPDPDVEVSKLKGLTRRLKHCSGSEAAISEVL